METAVVQSLDPEDRVIDTLQQEKQKLDALLDHCERIHREALEKRARVTACLETYLGDEDQRLTHEAANEMPEPQSLTEAAIRILEHAGTPLHYNEIFERINASPWTLAKERNTKPTLCARLSNNPRFQRVSSGTYALATAPVRSKRAAKVA